MNFYNIRPYINWILMLLAIVGVIYVGYYKSSSTTVLRVASGDRASHNFTLGKELKQILETHSDYKVELVESGHSSFNRGVVQSGKADVAFITPSATEMTNLSVIAPITTNYLHVIVKAQINIDNVKQLPGYRIALGGENSDHRKAGYSLLEHYQLEESSLRNTQMSHLDLLESEELDGAIVFTSLTDEYIATLLGSGKFKLLPIDAAEGLAQREPQYFSQTFPNGVYPSVYGPMPTKWLPTVSEHLWLVSRNDLADDILFAVLEVMDTKDFSIQFPLFAKWLEETNGQVNKLTIHESAQRKFDPYGTLQNNILDAVVVIWNLKWMLLFIAILLLNARIRWVDSKAEHQREKRISRTQRVQALLEDINNQETLQADTKDFRLLMQHLSEVRRIKTEGILVAKEHKMSDSAIFLSFLQQCDHVSRDIQWKLSLGLNQNESLK